MARPQALRQQASAGTGKGEVQPATKAAEAALKPYRGGRGGRSPVKRGLQVATPAAAAANATSSAAAAAKRLTTAAAHHQRSVAPHSTPTAAAASASTSAASAAARAKESASTGAASTKPHASVVGMSSKVTGPAQSFVPASSTGGQNIVKGPSRYVYAAPHISPPLFLTEAGIRWWKTAGFTGRNAQGSRMSRMRNVMRRRN